MKCQLAGCSNIIPKARKRSAKYCSGECYDQAKRERSCARYHSLASPVAELKRCEAILAYLYGIAQLKKLITVDDLAALNFNFGLATGEHFDSKRGPCKAIGKYAYHIDPHKTLTIWKLKQSQ